MATEENLGLNEALISVNKSSISSPLQVYHQNEECFGCPLEKLAELGGPIGSFKVDTRYNLKLKLEQSVTNSSCELDNLALNSHAHYRIEVTGGQNESAARLRCKLETLDSGDCLLCPFAILVCFLFAFMALEWAYVAFIGSRRQRLPSSSLSEADSGEVETAIAARAETSGRHEQSAATEDEKGNSVISLAPEFPATSPLRSNRFAVSRPSSGGGRRVECLDAFRGLTIAGMIFVNYGGAGYAIWEHRPWNGIALADFVFPFFIFSMGTSIAISVRSQIKKKEERKLPFYCVASRILRRSLILMALGVCLNSKWLDYENGNGFNKLRLTGVLQRFSISYLVVALMYAIELTMNKWIKAQSLSQVPYLSRFVDIIFELLVAINHLAIYVYVTFFVEYDPNCPAGYTGPGGQTEGGKYANCTGGAAAWLDHVVLGENHMYNDREVKEVFKTKVVHDPEGILGYTTSILLTLIGLQCGKILIGRRTGDTDHKSRMLALVQWIVLLAVGCSLVAIVPINKRLWSLTFIIVTALAAFVFIALLYIMLDVYACTRSFLLQLLLSAGKNPIFLYVGHSLVYNLLPWWFPISDPSSHLQLLLRLAWATLVWLVIAHYMACKNLFIRV